MTVLYILVLARIVDKFLSYKKYRSKKLFVRHFFGDRVREAYQAVIYWSLGFILRVSDVVIETYHFLKNVKYKFSELNLGWIKQGDLKFVMAAILFGNR